MPCGTSLDPAVFSCSARRNRGEAIGRMKRIVTPDRWFYTGMPPALPGGSSSNFVFIRPGSVPVLAEALDFPLKIL